MLPTDRELHPHSATPFPFGRKRAEPSTQLLSTTDAPLKFSWASLKSQFLNSFIRLDA